MVWWRRVGVALSVGVIVFSTVGTEAVATGADRGVRSLRSQARQRVMDQDISAPTASPVGSSVSLHLGRVHGSFFANPHNSGTFDRTPANPPLFTEQFPLVNFNPASSARVACANRQGVTEWRRPFTDLVPQPGGTCATQIAQGSAWQAGVGKLAAFEGVFTATLTVPAPGIVIFHIVADDGWVLALGANSQGVQPTERAGPLIHAPAHRTGAFTGYLVIGAANQPHALVARMVTVTVPSSGTYPLELDSAECCGGPLSLSMSTTFVTRAAQQGSWAQQALLRAHTGPEQDGFGCDVALSADGTLALVGANLESGGRGAAYIFTRSAMMTTWREQAVLAAPDGATRDYFGTGVALSGDGATALIGTNRSGNRQGVAYVFTRSETRGRTLWTQQAELSVVDHYTGNGFGYGVALSSDGATALVGAVHGGSGAVATGVAYIFARGATGGRWRQQAMVAPHDGTVGNIFGASVALNSNGTTALIGAPDYRSDMGAAYTFTRHDTASAAWHAQAELFPTNDQTDGLFGITVALDGHGSTALIATQGAGAYVFTSGARGTWTKQEELIPSDGDVSTIFSEAASLDREGTVALVTTVGGIRVFTRDSTMITDWQQQGTLTARDSGGDQHFGSAALSANGTTALVSTPPAMDSATAGTVYVFKSDPREPGRDKLR